MTTITWVRRMMRRDLGTLATQLDAYPDDTSLWKVVPGIVNPGGTLALHLVGNLRHFVGGQLGKSGYLRDRDAEFTRRNATRKELRDLATVAQQEVDRTLAQLDPAALDRPYPLPIAGATLSTGQFLLHLAGHFGYHLGQLDYHRRIVTRGTVVTGMQSPAALVDPAS
jgi:DinB superfamily